MVSLRVNLFILLFIFVSIVFHYQTQAYPQQVDSIYYDEKKHEECKAKCGGEQAENEAFRDRKGICIDPSLTETGEIENWGEPPHYIVTPCQLDCMNAKAMVPMKQQECFCKACSAPDLFYFYGFCAAPGVGRLRNHWECGESFCTGDGNAKFYGRAYCESG